MASANNTLLPSVRGAEFAAEANDDGSVMRIRLVGTADLAAKSPLDRFFYAVHAEAQRRGVEEVAVDLRRLEFMNSSCLKTLVWWVMTLHDQPSSARYRITFIGSPAMSWQRRSLNAVAALGDPVVSVLM